MDENIIYEQEAYEQADRLSLAFERDCRRYSSSFDFDKEAL